MPKIKDEDFIIVKCKDLKNLEVKPGKMVMLKIPKWMDKYFGLPKYQRLNKEWFDFCRRYPDLLFLDYYDLSERGEWTFYVIHKDDTVPEWAWKAIVYNGSTSSAKTIHLHEGIEAVDFNFAKNAFDGCDENFAGKMLSQFGKIHERTAVIQESELKESQQRLAEWRKELEAEKAEKIEKFGGDIK